VTSKGFPATVSAQSLGDKNDFLTTYEHGKLISQTLATAGINWNFAPVVDVNTNPNNPIIAKKERSFSANPLTVLKHATAYIDGHRQNHVLTSLKHFPGHGSSTGDSHLEFVDVTETWSEIELIPFQGLIDAGDVDAIMTAHVFNKNMDPDYPATLSKATITGVLRNRLKYDGVIISDDMQMGAIHQHYTLEKSIKLVLQAGVDVFLFSNEQQYDPEIAPKIIAIIQQLVNSGEISEAQITASYNRVQALKAKIVR